MAEVLFYHLERASLPKVLPGLLEKSLERGWKALVLTATHEQLEPLDEMLWAWRDESFLPHAIVKASLDASRETVLLDSLIGSDNATLTPANGAEILFLVEGAVADPSHIMKFNRVVMIFDGRNDEMLQAAREYWKAIRDFAELEEEGSITQTYWRQNNQGRWEKQA